MTKAVRRLDADDVWSAVETIDTVALLAEELIGRAIGYAGWHDPAGRLTSWEAGGGEYALFDGRSPDLTCALPVTCLRTVQVAALATLATRELLAPGGVTVAMLGTLEALQPQLAVLAMHVPDLVHVAVHVTDDADPAALKSRLVDQLDLAGIGLSVVSTLEESLFGANLVIAANEGAMSEGLADERLGHLVRGTVVVNATGRDLPTDLVDHVDQIYVDDLALLPEHTNRLVVGRHLTGPAENGPVIPADLGQLLSGAHAGREQDDDIVLVELLRANDLNVHLAHKIAEAARRSGLGTHVTA